MSSRVYRRGNVYHGSYYEAGERIQRSTRCTDRRAAERIVAEWERAAADPDHAATQAALVRDALRLLLDRVAELAKTGRRSLSTSDYYETKVGHLSRLLEPNEMPTPLRSLRATTIDAYVSARRREDVSDATLAKELGALRFALRLAKRAGIWRGDVDEIMPALDLEPYAPRVRWLPADELARLLLELGGDRAARVAFIVATSARWGETERAERSDGGERLVLLRGTKTRRSFREVPIVTEDQRALVELAFEHGTGSAPLLFSPWPNVRRDIRAACERASIDPCSPNDLRRTFAHWLRQSGAPADLVAPAMGHADSRMVERVYGRLVGDELRAALVRATAAPVSQPPRTDADSSDSPDDVKRKSPEKVVPRDRIELSTRGFSVRGNIRRVWQIADESRRNEKHDATTAAPVSQRSRQRMR